VRLITSAVFAVLCSGSFLGVFAQNGVVRSGFAIVTPISGDVTGLTATETLTNMATGEQAFVAPSVVTTEASLIVNVSAFLDSNTGIAIANPTSAPAGVSLTLTNSDGVAVVAATVRLGPREQFSRFINELFQTSPDNLSGPFLLTVTSANPVAILALGFRGENFASIPITSVPLTQATAIQLQSTQPQTAVPGVFPGFGIGLPPSTPIAATTSTNLGIATTTPVARPSGLVFAQVVTGNGWSTQIAVGNISAATQFIRVDFFDSNGVNTASLTDIAIQPRGVFFFSTDPAAVGMQ
jgi:hypothetical protein